VLARAIFAEGCKSVAAGMNPMDVKRGIDKAVAIAIADLQKQAKKLTEPKKSSKWLPYQPILIRTSAS